MKSPSEHIQTYLGYLRTRFPSFPMKRLKIFEIGPFPSCSQNEYLIGLFCLAPRDKEKP